MMQPIGSRRIERALLAGLCLALGACNSMGDSGGASLEQSVPNTAASMQALASPGALLKSSSRAATQLAPVTAVASLPEEAGTVAAVRGRGYVNGFRQDILLQGSAVRGIENGITIVARTSPQATLDEATPIFKPTEAAIRSELGRSFPHISMQVVERSSSNTYGAYGLALGRSGANIRCIYAWQWIDESSLGRDTGLSGPAALRIRLCRPDTTFDALAALVDRLTINHYSQPDQTAAAVIEPPTAASPKAVPHKRPARRASRAAKTQPPVDQTSFAAPQTVAAAPVVSQPLATDLPPQAYLGPNARTSPVKPNR